MGTQVAEIVIEAVLLDDPPAWGPSKFIATLAGTRIAIELLDAGPD